MFEKLFSKENQLVDLNLISENRPFFIYDQEQLNLNLIQTKKIMESMLDRTVTMSFSLKTQPNHKIISQIRGSGVSIDASSLNELNYAFKLNFKAKDIFLGGVGLTDIAIQEALAKNIGGLHLNSIELYKSSIFNLEKHSANTVVSIRFHPDYLKGSKIGENKEAILNEFKGKKKLKGLHVYVGRESFEEPIVAQIFKDIDELETAGVFSSDWTLFFGPGLPDLKLNPINSFKIQTKATKIKIEVGRSVTSSCGYYGAPVLSVKRFSSEKRSVIIDGGLQHFGSPWVTLRQGPSTMSGIFFNSQGTRNSGPESAVAIYGGLCLWHDCLHPGFPMPNDIKRGDWVVVPHMGAYGLTAGVPLFIGEVLPNEFYFDGGSFLNVTHKKFGEMAEE